MLNYNHLYYFHVAATEGTVAGAATRLGVGQPTVSEQIRALERTLGVSLFERTSSGLKLTEAGRFAFEHTSVMFRAGERLIESLGRGPAEVPRSLRVGMSSAVARATTTDFLLPLLALDDCIPCITSGAGVELLRDLRAGELDLVLCESEPMMPLRQGLQMAQISEVSLVAVAPPSVLPNADWSDVRLVQYRASSVYHADVEAYLAAQALRPKIAAEADDALFLLEAAARGGFVAFVPRSLARDAVAAGRVRIIARLDQPHGALFALYPDGATAELARRAVEVMLTYVKANPIE